MSEPLEILHVYCEPGYVVFNVNGYPDGNGHRSEYSLAIPERNITRVEQFNGHIRVSLTDTADIAVDLPEKHSFLRLMSAIVDAQLAADDDNRQPERSQW